MNLLDQMYVPLVKTRICRERLIPYGEEGVVTPKKVIRLVRWLLEGADREYTVVLSVDAKNKPVAVEIISIGTLNATFVEGREVFKHAILSNALGVILIHNHVSGEVEPSREDYLVTRKLKEAGELLGIELLDHIIVGDDEKYFSMQEAGQLTN